MTRFHTLLLIVSALALASCGGDEPDGPGAPGEPGVAPGELGAAVSDADLSLLQGSVFDDPTPPAVERVETLPGKNERRAPLFQGGPPRVPHGLTDLLPITLEDNACVECHLSDDPDDAPQVPESHRIDLRTAPEVVTDSVVGARWVCTACHVPLTDAAPLPQGAPED